MVTFKQSTLSLIAALTLSTAEKSSLKADCPYIDKTSIHDIYLAAQTIPIYITSFPTAT